MTVKHTQRKKKSKKQNKMKSPKDKHLQQKKEKEKNEKSKLSSKKKIRIKKTKYEEEQGKKTHTHIRHQKFEAFELLVFFLPTQ